MEFRNTFRVGKLKCEMSYSKEYGIKAEWFPHMPTPPLSKKEMRQYRSGRDNLMAEVAKSLGGAVVIIE